ncbi:MAG: AsmA-like C-terminal region-containing protein [Pseudomonadota bacterium]
MADSPDNVAPEARPRWLRRMAVVLAVALLAMSTAVAGLAVSGKSVRSPVWLTRHIEAWINGNLAGLEVEIGGIHLALTPRGVPLVRLRDLTVRGTVGQERLVLPDARLSLDRAALLRGGVVPRQIRFQGARLTLVRDQEGRFDLSFQSPGGVESHFSDYARFVAAIAAFFREPVIATVETVTLEDVGMTLTDRRRGGSIGIEGGQVLFRQSSDFLEVVLDAPLTGIGDEPGNVRLRLEVEKEHLTTRVSVNFEELPSQEIAAQSQALARLSMLTTRLTGAVRADIGRDGRVRTLNGTLSASAGRLALPDFRPVSFDGAQLYFAYLPKLRKLRISTLTLDAPEGRVSASGHLLIPPPVGRQPVAWLGQLRLDTLRLAPEGMFPQPLEFDFGAVDFRIHPTRAGIEIGQAVLRNQDAILHASGRFEMTPKGPIMALDARVDEIAARKVLDYWPADVAPKTRAMLRRSVRGGRIVDAEAALRMSPDHAFRIGLSYAFKETDILFLDTMPPITAARGHASFFGKTFSIGLQAGQVRAAANEAVQMAGSTLLIRDVTRKPGLWELSLRPSGPIPAILDILDREPLRLMAKAGRDPDLAHGRAQLTMDISFAMAPRIKLQDVTYRVAGRLHDVSSGTLIPKRMLTAEELTLTADAGTLVIEGRATLDKLPFRARWEQRTGPGDAGPSEVAGTVELSQRSLETLRIALPPGSLTGKGRAQFSLELRKGQAPAFRVTSDLAHVQLAVPALGWTKPVDAKGRFLVEGALGPTPEISKIAIEGAGLQAVGTLGLSEGGHLQDMRLSKLKVDSWLDVSAVLTMQETGGSPALSLLGGQLDMRGVPQGVAGGAGTAGGPISATLDRLILSDGVAITGFRGNFARVGGLTGGFTGAVNGAGRLDGVIRPAPNGPTVQLISADAGRVLRAAGVFQNAQGGTLSLILRPTGHPGGFAGHLEVQNARVIRAPAIAEMLSAISVIGLLEQLSGEGLFFSSVRTELRLSPGGVVLQKGSAVGPSMGISFEGVYAFADRSMDIQGVVSPFYFINGLGQFLARKREGLFGFTYRVAGPQDDVSISVNPLSVLAPGIFRELFRRAPPQAVR